MTINSQTVEPTVVYLPVADSAERAPLSPIDTYTRRNKMSRRPVETPYSQQSLQSYGYVFSTTHIAAIFVIFGIVLLPLGSVLRAQSDAVKEFSMTYDSSSNADVDCTISSTNDGSACEVSFSFTEDVTGPLYVYYEVTDFYQNHRRYVRSRSADQLMGSDLSYDDVYLDCYPLTQNGSLLINPCGLIANSFFNDIISLVDSPSDTAMDEDGITWYYDRKQKFQQVTGFAYGETKSFSVPCKSVLGGDYSESDCGQYTDTDGTMYYYYYPDDDSVQYLYESFPDNISPIDGVTDEHFISWMRTAGLSTFRKLYGKIDTDISSGDALIFNITTNFVVSTYGGTKALVVTTLDENGSKTYALGNSYIITGSVSLFVGAVFALKRLLAPRKLGDVTVLNWL